MKAKKILSRTPMIRWYLQHCFRPTAVDQLVECGPGKPFSSLPDQVTNARREADKNSLKNNWVTL